MQAEGPKMRTISHARLTGMLDQNGALRLFPASYYDGIPPETLRQWCEGNHRFVLPTLELVLWLRNLIGKRPALEIGAGHGDLAYHLGIPATDSYLHQRPEVAALRRAARQPDPDFPFRVRRMEAFEAVRHYRPEVVIAGWVDEWIGSEQSPPQPHASVNGVREVKLIEKGITYVLIGNVKQHQHRTSRMLVHRDYPFPWLRRCDPDQMLNRVWVWN